jgi:hypothetical protein
VSRMVDFKQLQRVVFRAESRARVKQLSGFGKGHAVPDRDSPSARKFIARLADDDIQADLERTYQALRERFGFKRRQMETSAADGCGVVRTPRFNYSVAVSADPANASFVVWRREISSLRDPRLLQQPEFEAVFGKLFDALVFEFAEPIAIARLVDCFEEEELPGMKIACASDATWCEITLNGFGGAIRIDRRSLTIEGRRTPSAASLLEQFLKFIAQVPRRRDWPALW